MSDEWAWSESFGPFRLVGRKSDRLNRKVPQSRRNGHGDHFYRSSETGFGFRALNLRHFWLDLEVVREDIWSGNMIIATTIQMLTAQGERFASSSFTHIVISHGSPVGLPLVCLHLF